ncbi:MAG: hydantoinase/oxoprolinase family protein [Gammaproteobacteria bacterium]|jgi:N-methylhydantoinase A|nr:hydantoinase/oxoprolinase family protein [Gammaproteobacteria bacterium]
MAAVGIDIGGTFTDVVIMHDDGSIDTSKSPSTPGRLLEGLLAALTLVAEKEGTDLENLLENIDRISHGTTAATNAFIERRGAKVAILTTRGFEDTMIMQRMMGMTAGLSPSELTDYSNRRVPEPLVPRSLIFGIRERVDYRGDIISPLREQDIYDAIEKIKKAGVEALAISYLWSFKNIEHEKRTLEILKAELPDLYISASHELVPLLGEYERTATTVVNAYLGPLVREYTDTLEKRLGAKRLYLLDSSGGLMTPAEAGRSSVRLLLSGPSGGVTAARYIGQLSGHENIITFDMGGTSADVAVIAANTSVLRKETVIDKNHLLLPMVDVRAIGAGGGSIAGVEEGGYLFVGPESAGAEPGPACYGKGGERPTVTDADVVLGIIDPAQFLGGKLELDVEKAREAIRVHVAEPLGLSIEEAAAGIKKIVDTRMADLLRVVTIEQGHDPREFVLYAFGGAGATHAPAFALDIVDEIIVPSSQSVFCAFGAVASDIKLSLGRALPKRVTREGKGDISLDEMEAVFAELEKQANDALDMQDVATDKRHFHKEVEVRFIRQTKSLSIPFPGSIAGLIENFLAAYQKRYGEEALPDKAGLEFVTYVVEASGELSRPECARYLAEGEDASSALKGKRPVYDMDKKEFVDTAVYTGELLKSANEISGPAVVEYEGTTVAISSNQFAVIDELLGMSIRRKV